uniref:NADH dehydrogenase subunit 4L n=1 Tax=Ammophila sabulosa TaxID=1088610 RepID=A0A7M4C8U8_9HYME|nr:NADH dehydrogenase subunit 4L [Ammophila sabulosa]
MYIDYCIILFFLSFSLMIYYYNRFLLNIISFEFNMISVLFFLFINLGVFNTEFMLISYVIIMVCESVMILCLLIMFLDLYKVDKISVLNIQF